MKRLISLLLALTSIVTGAAWTGHHYATPAEPTDAVFVIQEGDDLDSIVDRLKDDGFIRSRTMFKMSALGEDLARQASPGEYDLSEVETFEEIIARLIAAKVAAAADAAEGQPDDTTGGESAPPASDDSGSGTAASSGGGTTAGGTTAGGSAPEQPDTAETDPPPADDQPADETGETGDEINVSDAAALGAATASFWSLAWQKAWPFLKWLGGGLWNFCRGAWHFLGDWYEAVTATPAPLAEAPALDTAGTPAATPLDVVGTA